MNRLIETPIHGSYFATSRSLDGNRVENQHLRLAELLERLSELKNRLIELKIRFDSNPSRYLKEDYLKLIDILTSALLYLYNDLLSKIVTSWSSELSDSLVPSEKLVKETIDDLEEDIPTNVSELNNDAGYLTAHLSLKTINNESLVGNGNISITFPELEFASEADVEQVVPLLPEMVTEIVNETFDNSCLESFTGNSLYVPMSSEDVHNIIENVFNNEEYGTSNSES